MHNVIGLPKDPITRKEMPLSKEQLDFAKRALTFGNRDEMIQELTSALRKRTDVERRREMKKIAATILPDLEDDYMPSIPNDRIKWEYHCRQTIKGEPNRLEFLPMIIPVVEDDHPFKFLLWGRQWGKTTMLASDLSHAATTNYDYDQTYFSPNDTLLATFTEGKFRQPVFGFGPLSHYISGLSKLGAKNRVVTKTRCIIDMLTPGKNWINAQGKSNKRMIIDEGQDHNWYNFQNARQTQADTHGDIVIAGIGGFVDTAYHNLWKTTNQMEFDFKYNEPYMGYDNMSWRKYLEYDENGLVYGDYMKERLSGTWNPRIIENELRHGYHLTQLQNPRIPLTIKDAVEKYKIPGDFSIEWQEKYDPNYTSSEFRRNILAEFVEGELKPITTKDMMKLFDETLSLTKAEDVDHTAGDVIVGIDLGASGKTVVWIWQCINEKGPIFKLLWVEKVQTSNTREQERIVIDLIDAYEADFISTDAGGRDNIMQIVQDTYTENSVRVKYNPRQDRPTPSDEEFKKQESELRYVIDKTFSINRIIELIKHPYVDGDFTSNRIILPGDSESFEKIKWIIKQFVALEGIKEELKSTGQTRIRYTHQDSEPDDALMACNYAYIGWDIYKDRHSGPITFTQIKTPDPFGGY